MSLFSICSTRQAVTLSVLLCVPALARAEEPITFVLPAANFQPVAADAYAQETLLQTPPQSRSDERLTPPPTSTPAEPVVPESFDGESYSPTDSYEPLACPHCNGGGCDNCSGIYDRLPNGQIPDDWMWGCGGWPYANGPGTCDDWKVGPIWDVTIDGMVMTRENADLTPIQEQMDVDAEPEVIEQFDKGPGGRVFLTGLVPRGVGYQVMAGYEGIEEWNAAIVYPEDPTFPPFGTPTTRRGLYYRSSLHSGEINIVRMCTPALRPYCGVRYIKFDDEIWDQTVQEVTPFPGIAVNAISTLDAFDVENNLIGFQGGLKYDVWQFGRRLSMQGFLNSGVYYNKAKYSNLQQEFETQYAADGTSSSGSTSNLTIVEESMVSYVGEASLTAVCRLNRCWACRVGYQMLWISNVNLAQDAYLGNSIDGHSLIFHGWSAGLECRR